jgi:3-dehydroquinate synthase
MNVFFTGFMATGKSRVGHRVAELLGLPFEDTDHWIESRHRRTIPEIFAERGEAAFRDLEIEALEHLVADGPRVISLGGGTLLHPKALPLVHRHGILIGLHAAPEVIADRVGRKEGRPLLAGLSLEARLEKIRRMLEERAPLYAQADFQVESSESVSREQLAEQIVARLEPWRSKALSVDLGTRSYPIFAGTNIARFLPQLCRDRALGRPAVVVDSNVAAAHPQVLDEWRHAWPGLPVFEVPSGEEHKSWEQAGKILGWLLEQRLDRGSCLVAFGGGVTGDMTGFVASAYQRGIDFVQVPTTMLAMVDSSVGGKTAVNHPLGKNMIGAFHQPRLVLADMELLQTLPEREYLAGLAEVVKYGVALDEGFFASLEGNSGALLRRDPWAMAFAVRESCRLKAWVVSQDERETGLRALLNYGHTFGHALEALTRYRTWLHGEAIALGMRAAGRLATLAGLWEPACEARQSALLETLRFPTSFGPVPRDEAWTLMSRDKKALGGTARFVLPRSIGTSEVLSGFSRDRVDKAWEAVEPSA